MVNAEHKLLFIAFVFPPLAGPSPRHNLSTVRRLLAYGFLPTVVTAPEAVPTVPLLLSPVIRSLKPSASHWPQDESLRSLIPEEVTLLRCPWPLGYRRVQRELADHVRVPQLKYFFQHERNLMAKFALQALEADDFELIYSVDGLGVEHSAALELKRRTGLPWVAEFRDPWIHNYPEWQQIRDTSWQWWCSRQFKRVRKLEQDIVDNADLVIVESPLHAEYLVRDFKLEAQKVVPFGMGFEPVYLREKAEALVKFPARPVIGFVGRLYYGYQFVIRNLIEALRVLERQGYHFTLASVGGDSTFQTFAREAKLRNFVPIGTVDHSLALSLMNELDFGVVAACARCLSNINSKLWEYLALNLSVLAIAPRGGSMDSLITAGNCGYVLPYDVESMLPLLETALNDFEDETVKRATPEFVHGYSRRTMVAQLVKRLEALV
jgi:glycosyltransferase involved in cell wall biosynthesis